MATIVEMGFGKLEGSEDDGLVVFRGVPYAQPPLGPHRFRPPNPPEPWTGVRDATRFGPSAPQPKIPMAALPGMDVGEQSEDCLYLNVYTPACDARRRPVMVWIHGGGFVIGSGAQSIYDAGALVRRGDVVVVTINYRLGALGFLQLGEQDLEAANAGLLDQIAALEWVRDNIGVFGGDPGNVTIFGESAGGMSVGTLLGCPAARGLFHKAVPQSGACHATHDWESAAAVSAAMMEGLGLPSPHLQRLREIPVDRLLAVQQHVSLQMILAGGRQLLPFAPVVDGHVLPRHPLDALREGLSREVDVLVGTTRDEWRLFGFMDAELRSLDEDKLVARVQQRLPHADGRRMVRTYRSRRPEVDWASVAFAIETDRVFRIPAIRLAEAQAPHQGRVFKYLFSWESPALGGILGACHAIELPFLFDRLDLEGADKFVGSGPEAARLSEQTMGAWLAFARKGDPSHPGLDEWPAYDAERRATMELGRESALLEDPCAEERRLWEGVL